MIKFQKPFVVLLLSLCSVATVYGEAFKLNYDYVGPELIKTYQDNSDSILKLAEHALNSSVDNATRIDSLHTLKYDYPDAADQVALQLMESNQPEAIAIEATEIIASATVMSNHIVANKLENLSPGQHWIHRKHQLSLDALTKATSHPSKKVREIAASQGGALGYAPILNSIQSNINNGLYTDVEYINYAGLSADSNLVINHLKPYFRQNVDIANQVEAVKVASVHDEASQILAQFAFNEKTPQVLRVTAIEGLRGRVDYAGALLAVSLNASEDDTVSGTASSVFSDTVAAYPDHFSIVEIDAAKKAYQTQLEIKNNPALFESIRTLERVEAQFKPSDGPNLNFND